MTKRSYFGKMNSTLGSVVPLAMFFPSFQLCQMIICIPKGNPTRVCFQSGFYHTKVCNANTQWQKSCQLVLLLILYDGTYTGQLFSRADPSWCCIPCSPWLCSGPPCLQGGQHTCNDLRVGLEEGYLSSIIFSRWSRKMLKR